ncbi:MAG: choice-of-anchor V domain-containing protein [bacterium]|nr:choice-of-anchor V domain-containing protein [bacterium]
MKRKTLLLLSSFAFLIIGLPNLQSYPTGAPSDGRTGSPGDGGKTCATSGCHNVTASSVTGILSSNIPVEGYTPGASYTITASIDGNGNKGLCVSPQKTDGTLMGTLTAGAGNQLIGGKYITHTSPKTTDPGVFTFTWVAPASGSGAVDFYGAFANNRTMVRKVVYTVNEKLSSGINERYLLSDLNLFPNPIVNGDKLHVAFELKQASDLKISLMDITGKEIIVFKQSHLNAASFNESYSLPELGSGIYFVRIEGANNLVLNRKLLIQKN